MKDWCKIFDLPDRQVLVRKNEQDGDHKLEFIVFDDGLEMSSSITASQEAIDTGFENANIELAKEMTEMFSGVQIKSQTEVQAS